MPGLVNPGIFESFFGDLADSDLNYENTGWAQLTADRSCRNITITGSRGLSTNNWRIFCHRMVVDSTKSSVASDGMIQCNGGDAQGYIAGSGPASGFFGGGAHGGPGGLATSATGSDPGVGGVPPGFSLGGAGGKGGEGLSSVGAAGGTPTQLAAPFRRASFFTALTGMFTTPSGLVVPSGGAGGGGGGRRDGTTALAGGGGGGPAGILFIAAAEIVLVGTNPHFAVHGGNGAPAVAGIGAGGGGGGSAGAIILVYGRMIGQLVTNLAGGSGGAGSTPGQNDGTAGQNGNLFLYQL